MQQSDENLSFVSSLPFLKSSQVIINCVCAPDQSLNSVGAFAVTPLKPLLHPQQPPAPHNRVLAHMWQVVQNNNGIKVRAADEQWKFSRFDSGRRPDPFGASGVKICQSKHAERPAVVTPVVNKRSPESEMLLVFLVSSPGAAVPAVSEDAHHGRRPDPRSRLQSSGRTLPQLRHQTDHQQAAALHQEPHSAGAHRCII